MVVVPYTEYVYTARFEEISAIENWDDQCVGEAQSCYFYQNFLEVVK